MPVILLLLLVYTSRINWKNGQWEHVLEADAKGYYAYLPALFIYHDLNFSFFGEVEGERAYDPSLAYDYRYEYEGRTVNKYYAGVAVCQAPFFLVAHAASLLLDYPADGYSQLYIIFITLAALFYLYLGLLCLRRSLELLGIDKRSIFIVITTLVFGTHLFYYSIGEMGMSHVYSFALVSAFIYCVLRYFRNYSLRFAWIAAAVLGLIILVRPVNGLVLLSVPFLSGGPAGLREGIGHLFRPKRTIVLLTLLTSLVISLQLVLYKLQTGYFFVYSYGEEGFEFTHPHGVDFLFSYRKGLFVYTPLCLLALAGLTALWRRNRFRAWSLLGFLMVVVYVLSSWWNWYYGGSFSARVMVEYLPYFTISLAYLFMHTQRSRLRYMLLTGITSVLLLLNQVQTLQYRYYIIHWSEMNRESYWDVFLDLEGVIKRK